MKKKIIFMLSLVGIPLLSTSNAYAGIVETLSGGVDVYQKFIEARHWAAFMAAGVLIAIFRALPSLKPAKFKITAIGRAFLMFVAGFFCVFLMIYEWWPAIALSFGFIFDILYAIFDYARESFTEFFDYITDL